MTLRLLPAGAIAGWDFHPLESAAFARRTPEAVIRFASSVLRTGLFGQPRFPKPLNKQLCVFGGPGDTPRYCIGGIDLKHTRRRVVRLSVTSEMGEGGREAAAGCHIGGILTKGFLQYDD